MLSKSIVYGFAIVLSWYGRCSEEIKPPVPKEIPHVKTWHGEKFSDSFQWLENKDHLDVLQHLKAENAYTEAISKPLLPLQEQLYKEILSHTQQTDLSVPNLQGSHYYFKRVTEGKQYPVYYRSQSNLDGTFNGKAQESLLLDQNELAKGLPFLELNLFKVSDDENKLLFATDVTGYNQNKLFIKDLSTGKMEGPLAENVIEAEWDQSSRQFFFTTEDPVTKRADTLWRYSLHTGAKKIYHEKDWLFALRLSRSKSGQWVFLSSNATDTTEVRAIATSPHRSFIRVISKRLKGHKYYLEHNKGYFLILTNKNAKNYRLDYSSCQQFRHWKTLLQHDPRTYLLGMHVFESHMVVQAKQEGLDQLLVYNFKNKLWKKINFNDKAYSAKAGENASYTAKTFRYTYESLITPKSIMDYSFDEDKSVLKKCETIPNFNPKDFVTERLWATSRDGIRLPISIVYPRHLKKDGSAPLFLEGYGAYGTETPPVLFPQMLCLLKRGFAYAIAHVRGGCEMGEAWHDDGMLMKKKNTFHDFIDCSEFLIRERWTSKKSLVIKGESAGGLLIGAVVNERPDLFAAAHLSVPFVDVMNTMMNDSLPLTTGEYLEWGNPNQKKAFDYMLGYSPYDNIKQQAYPPMLVTTSYNDCYVMYWEPAKFTAKMRKYKTDAHPMLLKCLLEPAGHSGPSGRYSAWKERAFELAWILQQVGIKN